MARIDIREYEEDFITEIKFATEAGGNAYPSGERTGIACFISDPGLHPRSIYLNSESGEYVVIRKHDIKNLIKALEKAIMLWPDA